MQIFAQLNVAQPFSGCSQLLASSHLHGRVGLLRRGDCMFIEKARQLEYAQAIGGIVIDHNASLKSSNGAIFSMTGDGNNNVRIPLVLMFKEEAFQLLHALSHQPNIIVYIGEEKRLRASFYEQLDYLESLLPPFNQTCEKWIYGQRRPPRCSLISNKLKLFESFILRDIELPQEIIDLVDEDPIIEFEHVIQAGQSTIIPR